MVQVVIVKDTSVFTSSSCCFCFPGLSLANRGGGVSLQQLLDWNLQLTCNQSAHHLCNALSHSFPHSAVVAVWESDSSATYYGGFEGFCVCLFDVLPHIHIGIPEPNVAQVAP